MGSNPFPQVDANSYEVKRMLWIEKLEEIPPKLANLE
jgi:hypothetical protein